MKKDKVTIIAEAGVNHNGNIENAYRLIDAAVAAGADYVKFQTFKADKLASAHAKKAAYQIDNAKDQQETQLEMLKRLELSEKDHEDLIRYCKLKGIKFFSTAFDLDSLAYLAKMGFKMVKIPSGEITNLPYLRKAATLFENIIISTGMANLEEISDAIQVFTDAGITKDHITILHCNTEYPTPMQDVNLKAMMHIARKFETAVGYSDHTLGIEVPIAAVALGASMIEKHFTLNKNMDGPDHKASLEPHELAAMVSGIRNIESAMAGSGLKAASASEKKNMLIARKSIVAQKEIKKGELFTNENLTTKRPGDGISPMNWDLVIGKTATRNYTIDELIEQ